MLTKVNIRKSEQRLAIYVIRRWYELMETPNVVMPT